MLSKRLSSLTKYINNTDNIIDIGCDHALLDIYLVKNNIVDGMIVSDIHQNALNQGINNINTYKLSDKIDTRLGNGLEVLNDNEAINTVLISGMGTSTILSILENKYINNINKLIIQSNNDYELLRKSIVNMGFIISDEEFFIDKNKEYINIVFVKGSKEYTKEELKYGPFLIKDKKYMKSLIDKKEEIIDNIPEDRIDLKDAINGELNVLYKYIK